MSDRLKSSREIAMQQTQSQGEAKEKSPAGKSTGTGKSSSHASGVSDEVLEAFLQLTGVEVLVNGMELQNGIYESSDPFNLHVVKKGYQDQ